MQPTTPTKPVVAPKSPMPIKQWALPLGFAALGVLILGLALPAFHSRFIQLRADETRESILNNQPVTLDALDAFIATRKQALGSRETSGTMEDLAFAMTLRSYMNEKKEAIARNERKEAVLWQTLSLARAPANAFGWTRLASLQIQNDGISPMAAAALALSLETAPYEPSLSLPRLRLAMALYGNLDADAKERIPSLVRAAWENEPEQLAIAAENNHYVSVVEQALINDKAALDAFRDLLPSKKKADEEASSHENEASQEEADKPTQAAEDGSDEEQSAVRKSSSKSRKAKNHTHKRRPVSEDDVSE